MKQAILLVAHSAHSIQSRDVLARFEGVCRQAFPNWTVRWAYTSPIGRERLALQKLKSDGVYKALMRLGFEGFSRVAVQPLQIIAGSEHEQVAAALQRLAAGNPHMKFALGLPLLHGGQDMGAVANALISHLPMTRAPGDNVIFMGHGARHRAGLIYADLHYAVQRQDASVHIGTMQKICTLEDILPRLTSPVVWLLPLLATIGQHALKDMAGKDPRSWRSRIEAAGHKCCPLVASVADIAPLQQIWLGNLARAVAELNN